MKENLTAALDRATTWSSYLDSMLSGAVTLHNAETDPKRAYDCILQAAHAASLVAAALSEYAVTFEQLDE